MRGGREPFGSRLCPTGLALAVSCGMVVISKHEKGVFDHGVHKGLRREIFTIVRAQRYAVKQCLSEFRIFKEVVILKAGRVQRRWKTEHAVRQKIGHNRRPELWVCAGPLWGREALHSRLIGWFYKRPDWLGENDLDRYNEKGASGQHLVQADHRNLDCRANTWANIQVLTLEEHSARYKLHWRAHIGLRKKPAAVGGQRR